MLVAAHKHIHFSVHKHCMLYSWWVNEYRYVFGWINESEFGCFNGVIEELDGN